MAHYQKADPIHRMTRYGLGTMLLSAAMVFLAAPAAPSTAQVTRYLIVSGDSSSGSWDSHDEPRFEAWRSK